MLRRSVTTSLLPSGVDQQRQIYQQSITVVENIRHRQQMDDDDNRWTETSAQLTKTNERRWSSIWGAWTRNGRKQSEENSAEELISALKRLRCIGKMAAKSAEAQTKGAAALAKWAKKSENEVMAEVVERVSELLEMHAERQHTFAKDYGHYLRQLQKVAETERKMRAQCRKVEKLTEKEKRISKMLAKRGDDEAELRAKLDRAKRDREWAERETEEQREEHDFARMAHLEAALKGMADVQLNLARAGQLIFTCQSELTALVSKRMKPTEDEGKAQPRHHQQRCEEVSQTRQKMAELRRSLETGEIQTKLAFNAPSSVERRQRQRRSDPSPAGASARLVDRRFTRASNPPGGSSFGTPPPPYTPSAPPLEMLDIGTRSSDAFRHSIGPSLLGAPPPTEAAAAQRESAPRIYPRLPPNPFAEELKLRRRCREATLSVE